MTDFMWELFEQAVTLFEAFVYTNFLCRFLGLIMKSKKERLIYIVGSLSFAVITIILNQFTAYEGLFGLVFILLYFIYALLFLRGSVLKKLFASILVNIVLICVNAAVSSVVSAAFGKNISEIYTEQSLSRFIMIVIVQIILLYIFGIILRLTVHKDFSLKKSEWALIFSVFVVSFISLAVIHMTQLNADLPIESTRLLLISELGIILTNIICFYMTIALSKRNFELTKSKLDFQQQEFRMQYAENIRRQYEETRRIRHDMKQNFSVISTLLKESKLSEAICYAEKCSDNLSKLDIIMDVGNDFINAILNTKLSLAKGKNIEMICSSSSDISGIDDIDLCDLLGNMLDNAIEACEKCKKDKLIEVSIISDEDKLLINISNTIEWSVLSENTELRTEKENKELHGYGVKTIRAVAEKYHGTASFYEDNGKFISQAVLYK